jgi:hypothetical protein
MIRVGPFEEFNLNHKPCSSTPVRDARVCPEGLLPKGGQSKVDCDGLAVGARIRVRLPTRSLHQGESQRSFEESRPTLLASASFEPFNRLASTTSSNGFRIRLLGWTAARAWAVAGQLLLRLSF